MLSFSEVLRLPYFVQKEVLRLPYFVQKEVVFVLYSFRFSFHQQLHVKLLIEGPQ